jgi:arylsulfatase A-like enzyme
MNTPPASLCTLVALCLSAVHAVPELQAASTRPNILLVMTDDQGFGDFGFQGNPVIKTPVLDTLSRSGVRFTNFHVSPVCTPTRASLMTGRYNYRTRAIDTYIGRAMMDPAEVTLAETLRAAGYRTGHFGKWHLGDCHPLRSIDQGFEEALAHRGGGLRQPADAPGCPGYTNPFLFKNGEQVASSGYCTDVFADAAAEFIERQGDEPFFVYLALNAPHGPFEVLEADLDEYRNVDVSPERFPSKGRPIEGKPNDDTTRRVYAMVSNFDRAFGRLLKRLDDRGLTDNTIVVFLTDNGTAIVDYNVGLRGRKGTVYDGGIRTTCLVRWPAKLKPGTTTDILSAHIDVVPTLLAATGVAPSANVALDGINLLPWMLGERTDQTDRTLHFQWHRGDVPQEGRSFAVKTPRWKLVQPDGVPENAKPPFRAPELYDIAADPFEEQNLAEKFPEVAKDLRERHRAWFADVSATRGYAPPRIALGTPHEKTTCLTRQDWRGPHAGWTPKSVGEWLVASREPHRSRVVVRFAPGSTGMGLLKIGATTIAGEVRESSGVWTIDSADIPSGEMVVRATLATNGGEIGPTHVELTRLAQ